MARITQERPLLLGSGSPRRREILGMLGIPHVVIPASIDESVESSERADSYLERVVAAKRDAARRSFDANAHAAVLVADTSVIVDGEILGKPDDEAHALAMVKRLAGRSHAVYTRFSVWSAAGEIAETVITEVFFRAVDDARIARYAATGEGNDKAGAYAIQGRGAALVSKIVGSYTNVVGLPACELVSALERLELWP